ncbi:hypothetical protein GCM10022225_80040 [Plantactinospora mayteni]|uniref:Uncharacterized protein n=1 Tax=Plantactinospora mayteni TaxID=566021 RepID=A0ABQ4F378_9ACTN|nr:hypothetical protein Pma05_79250 [Plantactinospora mayteni]
MHILVRALRIKMQQHRVSGGALDQRADRGPAQAKVFLSWLTEVDGSRLIIVIGRDLVAAGSFRIGFSPHRPRSVERRDEDAAMK